MNKTNLKGVVNTVKIGLSKNSPAILIGIGIAGMLTTTVLAVKATPKALELIKEEKERLKEHPNDVVELKPVEVVKVTWKCYIPAAISGTVAVACIIGANSVNVRRNAALATAYKLSETAFSEYKEKVVETIGERKERTVKDKVAQSKLDKNPVNDKQVIIMGNTESLCFDPISSRYFTSDIETIRRAVNTLNKKLISQDYISLNEFYDELGLDHTSIGYDLGWSINRDGLVDLDYSTQLAKDGRPCLVLEYQIEPRYDFSKLY